MLDEEILVLGGLALLALVAAKKPIEYICSYCGASFTTYEELVEHVQTEHPGERIPLPIDWE